MTQKTNRREGFPWYGWAAGSVLTLLVALLCVCAGSVPLPMGDTLAVIGRAIRGVPVSEGLPKSIILSIRLPRVLCAGLSGAALALCGAAMQGLLRNPLADGSTLGVSSGGALGAALAIVLGISIPGLPLAASTGMAMLFAFGSLMIILTVAYAMDHSLATQTIILIGVIFSMLSSALLSLLIAFSGEKLRSITFWTMGSLSGRSYTHVLILLFGLLVCGGVLLSQEAELNAFAVGEENARHVGVPVRRVKMRVMIAASALIGICVSVGGSIGFVGLIVPHMVRLVTGPNHRKMLPTTVFSGAIFLMLTDLMARTVLSPIELPIGVVTSLIGAVMFVSIFYRSRKGGRGVC
ncbi:MAG: iron ABC transporter permease [Clostridia bacterium]|nr:iron ABC transporter permease [Clostridia bacterium]